VIGEVQQRIRKQPIVPERLRDDKPHTRMPFACLANMTRQRGIDEVSGHEKVRHDHDSLDAGLDTSFDGSLEGRLAIVHEAYFDDGEATPRLHLTRVLLECLTRTAKKRAVGK
jgi:hypothetical protein